MRSCSGWPSGVWIDEPKRTAPDGSSFSWQHWSHTFEYALVSSGAGRGDWRDGGFPAAGEAYNHPLLARETGIHAGPLPAAASLFQIDVAGPGDVALAALKPRGNPAAAGQPGRAAWRAGTDAVTLRLRETSGRGARVRLNAAAGRLTDLLEERDGAPLGLAADGAPVASLAPLQTMTLLVVPGARGPAQPAGQESTGPAVPAGRAVPTATVLNTEPAQPVFTRYWLHGKGPAPAGSLPAAVHISPARNAVPRADAADATEGATVNVRITVSGGPARTAGMVELDVPAGLTAKPAGPLPYDLPAGAHAGWDVAVRPAGPSGRYFLSARIRDAAGQVLEDVATIAVGEEPVPPLDTPLDELLPRLEADQRATAAELDVTLTGGDLTLTPGERAQLEVRLANHARAQIRGEAQLVSPFGTWDAIAPWTQGFCVDPGSEHAVRYEVAAPAAARPGSQWWALVKVCYFGRLHYTGAIRVSIVV